MMICPHCHAENVSGEKVCNSCGRSLSTVATQMTGPLVPPATAPRANPTRKLAPQTTGTLSAQTRSPRSGDTQPLTTRSFLPLPEGALIGAYVVTLQYKDGPKDTHLYQVKSRRPQLPCPQCGLGENAADKKFCTRCGFDLKGQQPVHPSYLLTEAEKPQTLGGAFLLTNLPLKEPGVRLPLKSLQQTVADKPRYYLISDLGGQPLSTWQTPVEATQAVKWGATLAHALDDLQQHNVSWPQLTAKHIMVEGEEVYFAGFTDAIQGRASAANVSQLATIINGLMTGKNHYTPHPELSDNLNTLLKRAITQAAPVSAAELATAFEQEGAQIRRPDSVKLQLGQTSDVGMVRQLNEDSMLSLHFTHNNRSHNKPVGVYIVADGMGGHEGGEVASGMTIEKVGQLAVSDLLPKVIAGKQSVDYETWLRQSIQAANKDVYDMAKASRNDMGTTVVAAVVVNDEVYIGHAGDSRAYRVNAGRIEQLTTDHSLVERLVATGQITREEARHHPQGNVVYRTIGDKAKLEVDTMRVRLAVDDYLLLCSDGLTGMVTDERIQKIVSQSGSPQQACDELIRAANVAGGDDNITVVIVKVEP